MPPDRCGMKGKDTDALVGAMDALWVQPAQAHLSHEERTRRLYQGESGSLGGWMDMDGEFIAQVMWAGGGHSTAREADAPAAQSALRQMLTWASETGQRAERARVIPLEVFSAEVRVSVETAR